jgi:hypothetical protein
MDSVRDNVESVRIPHGGVFEQRLIHTWLRCTKPRVHTPRRADENAIP